MALRAGRERFGGSPAVAPPVHAIAMKSPPASVDKVAALPDFAHECFLLAPIGPGTPGGIPGSAAMKVLDWPY